MENEIRTIFNSRLELTSASEEFYSNYWTKAENVDPEVTRRNKSKIAKFFHNGLLSDKNILEIGVGGEGGIIINLQPANRVYGLDVSSSAVSNCRKMGLNVQTLNLDRQSIPFDNEFFDVVFAMEVFEHFSNPQYALEEIRRVLKPNGKLLISIPSAFTYHWPRLFYPGLFEKENFKEFLMVNEFIPSFENDWILKNCFCGLEIPEDHKSWSWYYLSEKVDRSDYETLFAIGKHFWDLKNEYQIRTRPVEALELFTKCLRLNPENYKIRFYYTFALLYRAIFGDPDAKNLFNKLIPTLLPVPEMADPEMELHFLEIILELCAEFTRIGYNVFYDEYISAVKNRIAELDQKNSLCNA